MEAETAAWVRAIFGTLYPLWGVVWGLVALSYGRAAYVSWISGIGTWRGAVPDLASPFIWGVRSWWDNLLGRPHKPYVDKYKPGHLLRFAVFLGALSPAVWGFYFVLLDRSQWTPAAVVVNGAGVLMSILAAWSHLWLAYRKRPTLWSRGVVATIGWLLVAPFALRWAML